jgi:peptide/nickel transport system permease protein
MKNLQRQFKEILRYPSAVAGLTIIFLLILLAVYALVSIPYDKAVLLWRGGEEIWYQNPKAVPPVWVNLFRSDKLPRTIALSSEKGDKGVVKTVTPTDSGDKITITYSFDYPYTRFPQEISLFFKSQYTDKEPFIAVSWLTPDGRNIRIGEFSIGRTETYRVSQDTRLARKFTNMAPQVGLFFDVNAVDQVAVKGTYTMTIEATTFEKGANIDAEFVLYGQTSGWAGTDHRRRDIGVALLWGTPVALAFGLLAALGTTLTTMVIAAVGTWFAGWVDELIQRVTEVNLVLPFLPILIMVSTFYSRSIWAILGVSILLSIFGAGIKTYRAIFMQVKESAYIEAAQAYGASSWRIIFQYLTPRIIPLLIPQLVTLIPTYVFLEATLAVLGLGDPVLPTWGKIINDGWTNGALYRGLYYWVLEPSFLLMLTGLAFAMLGFSLDRVFNPRLRGQ